MNRDDMHTDNVVDATHLEAVADALIAAHGAASRDGDSVLKVLIEAALLHVGRRLIGEIDQAHDSEQQNSP